MYRKYTYFILVSMRLSSAITFPWAFSQDTSYMHQYRKVLTQSIVFEITIIIIIILLSNGICVS